LPAAAALAVALAACRVTRSTGATEVMILSTGAIWTVRLSAPLMEWGRDPAMLSAKPASASGSGTGLAIANAARPRANTVENFILMVRGGVKESNEELKNGIYQAQLE
jgi:hypothetical protein